MISLRSGNVTILVTRHLCSKPHQIMQGLMTEVEVQGAIQLSPATSQAGKAFDFKGNLVGIMISLKMHQLKPIFKSDTTLSVGHGDRVLRIPTHLLVL